MFSTFRTDSKFTPSASPTPADNKLSVSNPDQCKGVRGPIPGRPTAVVDSSRLQLRPSFQKSSLNVARLTTLLLAALASLKGGYASHTNQITVGVMDAGIDINHAALMDNIFINHGEKALNGVDDDDNGYVDDLNGFNFVDHNGNIPAELHATHVAGIIAGKAPGTTEVPSNVKLLPLRLLGKNRQFAPLGTSAEIIRYAQALGARIINMSIDGPYEQVLYDAMKNSSMLFVIAAGNSNQDLSKFSSFPASYELNNSLVVAALEANGSLAGFSNYGGNVDVGAPGVAIESTAPNNTYTSLSGTSMAAPFVVNLLVHELLKNKSLTNDDLKNLMKNSPRLVRGDRLIPLTPPKKKPVPPWKLGAIGAGSGLGALGLCTLAAIVKFGRRQPDGTGLAPSRPNDIEQGITEMVGQPRIADDLPPVAGHIGTAMHIV